MCNTENSMKTTFRGHKQWTNVDEFIYVRQNCVHVSFILLRFDSNSSECFIASTVQMEWVTIIGHKRCFISSAIGYCGCFQPIQIESRRYQGRAYHLWTHNVTYTVTHFTLSLVKFHAQMSGHLVSNASCEHFPKCRQYLRWERCPGSLGVVILAVVIAFIYVCYYRRWAKSQRNGGDSQHPRKFPSIIKPFPIKNCCIPLIIIWSSPTIYPVNFIHLPDHPPLNGHPPNLPSINNLPFNFPIHFPFLSWWWSKLFA